MQLLLHFLSLSLCLRHSYTHTHRQVLLFGNPHFTHTHTHSKHTKSTEDLSWSTFLVLRNLTFCLHGGLPQTRPADSAGAQEHRQPPPNQLYQGNNCSGQWVSRLHWLSEKSFKVCECYAQCKKFKKLKCSCSMLWWTPTVRELYTGHACTDAHTHAHRCTDASEGPKEQHVLPLFPSSGLLTYQLHAQLLFHWWCAEFFCELNEWKKRSEYLNMFYLLYF